MPFEQAGIAVELAGELLREELLELDVTPRRLELALATGQPGADGRGQDLDELGLERADLDPVPLRLDEPDAVDRADNVAAIVAEDWRRHQGRDPRERRRRLAVLDVPEVRPALEADLIEDRCAERGGAGQVGGVTGLSLPFAVAVRQDQATVQADEVNHRPGGVLEEGIRRGGRPLDRDNRLEPAHQAIDPGHITQVGERRRRPLARGQGLGLLHRRSGLVRRLGCPDAHGDRLRDRRERFRRIGMRGNRLDLDHRLPRRQAERKHRFAGRARVQGGPVRGRHLDPFAHIRQMHTATRQLFDPELLRRAIVVQDCVREPGGPRVPTQHDRAGRDADRRILLLVRDEYIEHGPNLGQSSTSPTAARGRRVLRIAERPGRPGEAGSYPADHAHYTRSGASKEAARSPTPRMTNRPGAVPARSSRRRTREWVAFPDPTKIGIAPDLRASPLECPGTPSGTRRKGSSRRRPIR